MGSGLENPGIPGSISLNLRMGSGATFSRQLIGVSHIITAAIEGQRVSL
jgi:hypothetical protein